nr:unnamed protein product [Spirometra erinaceieuropaei]
MYSKLKFLQGNSTTSVRSASQFLIDLRGVTYEQIKGTPMGSPVSSFVAELVLQELEKIAFIQYEPVFWRLYIDGTFVIVKDMLQHFHSLLNAVFPDRKFTREEEQKQQLPLLDVLVRRNLNGELETKVYRKQPSGGSQTKLCEDALQTHPNSMQQPEGQST